VNGGRRATCFPAHPKQPDAIAGTSYGENQMRRPDRPKGRVTTGSDFLMPLEIKIENVSIWLAVIRRVSRGQESPCAMQPDTAIFSAKRRKMLSVRL